MNNIQEDYPLLVAQEGPLKGQRWPLSQTIVLGREPTCDIVVADRQISRFHARLTPTPEGVIFEDLGSKNGTHHNGVTLTSPVVLQDGDLLSVALAQQFKMLWLLYESKGQVVTRPDLVAVVWGDDQAVGVSDQALDALIRRLRDRLAALDPTHQYIVTVRGHGIRLDNPPL